MKDDQTKKYSAYEPDQKAALERVCEAERLYCLSVFEWNENKTRRQAQEEFWQMVAEHYGFEIDLKREVCPKDQKKNENNTLG